MMMMAGLIVALVWLQLLEKMLKKMMTTTKTKKRSWMVVDAIGVPVSEQCSSLVVRAKQQQLMIWMKRRKKKWTHVLKKKKKMMMMKILSLMLLLLTNVVMTVLPIARFVELIATFAKIVSAVLAMMVESAWSRLMLKIKSLQIF
jgi:hypothetical protein